jgi:tRNA-dihydrouridine synthase A
MITSKAILKGDNNRLLDYNAVEHPLVLQIGGSDPVEMADCAVIAKRWGYDAVNINVGCPSDRVMSGSFGACLMRKPNLVASCVESMIEVCDIPVSVKSRIGIDEMETYDELSDFVYRIHKKGCQHFIIHARKAWLHGLSPKQNRTIPPLNYPWVYEIKKDFPRLKITINGGITNTKEVLNHLKRVDGVMLGRAIYNEPFTLTEIDSHVFGVSGAKKSREKIVIEYIKYIERQHKLGVPVRAMTRHILGLYHGQKNAKMFRRLLSGNTVDLSHLNEWLNFANN